MNSTPVTQLSPEQLQKNAEACKPGAFYRALTPKKTLQLTGGLTYCKKLLQDGQVQDGNPFVYNQQYRTVGYASDIAAITGLSVEDVVAQSINPLTDEGKEVVEAAIRERRLEAKRDELSFDDVLFILDHIAENKDEFTQKVSKATAPAGSAVAPKRRRRGSLPSMIRSVLLQEGDGLNHVISVARFNLDNKSGCHFVTMTKGEREGDFSRARNKRPSINGRVLPIRIGASEASRKSAEEFCQYLDTLPDDVFGDGLTFQIVAQSIRECIDDQALQTIPMPEPMRRQQAMSPAVAPRQPRQRKPSSCAPSSAELPDSPDDDDDFDAFELDELDELDDLGDGTIASDF